MSPQYMNIDLIEYWPLPIRYFPNEKFVRVIHKSGIYLNYAVSNYGRLFSFYRNKLMNPFKDKDGYYRVSIMIDKYTPYFVGVHYLELMSFKPIYNTDDYVVNHIDGDPANNLLINLEWVTISENTIHAIKTGLINYVCENSPTAIFDNKTVHYICQKLESGMTVSQITTNLFPGISGRERNRIVKVINAIKRGQSYLSISKNYNISGLSGNCDYPEEMTKAICDILSIRSISIKELGDIFNIELKDRKMFLNYVRDITRRQKHTKIVNQYPILNKVLSLDKNDPDHDWYY